MYKRQEEESGAARRVECQFDPSAETRDLVFLRIYPLVAGTTKLIVFDDNEEFLVPYKVIITPEDKRNIIDLITWHRSTVAEKG